MLGAGGRHATQHPRAGNQCMHGQGIRSGQGEAGRGAAEVPAGAAGYSAAIHLRLVAAVVALLPPAPRLCCLRLALLLVLPVPLQPAPLALLSVLLHACHLRRVNGRSGHRGAAGTRRGS